jgi:nitrate/nitrite-specific signal transduction histidine kinase
VTALTERSGDDHSVRAKIAHLENVAAAMRSPQPLATVIDLVIGEIAEVVPSDAAAIWIHDTDRDEWYIAGSRGLTRRASQISFQSNQTLHSRIGDHGEIITNLTSAGFRRLYPEHTLVSCALYAPMNVAGVRVGLIALYRNDPAEFVAEDLRYVRTVGASIGMAIAFAVLEARAEKLAVKSERARLGADLHDAVMQMLAAVRLHARELRELLEPVCADLAPDRVAAISQALSKLEDCVADGSEDLAATIRHTRTVNGW